MTVKFLLGCAIVVSTTLPALAADLDPASAKLLHDYPLTLAKVQAYEAAYEALTAAAAADASLKAEQTSPWQTRTMFYPKARSTPVHVTRKRQTRVCADVDAGHHPASCR